MNTPIKRILVLMAMEAEAAPVIQKIGFEPLQTKLDELLPFNYFWKKESQREIYLIVSGKDERYGVDNIGTQAATLMAYVGIEKFQPNIVFSIGTAGGFARKGATIGTVYLSDDEFNFHDRSVPLPGFEESGIGHYPALNVRKMAQDLNCPVGKVSSGSSFKKDPEQLELMLQSGAVAKEMEVAAIAWVCWVKKIPLVAAKSITNLLDATGSSEDQFLKNFSIATQELSIVFEKIIKYLEHKGVQDLAGV